MHERPKTSAQGMVMAKGLKSAKSFGVSGKPTASKVQQALQALDQHLLALINRRAELSLQLAELRKEEGEPDFQLSDEDRQLAAVLEKNPGPLSRAATQAIFREVLSACRALIKPLRVAYLGPQYSYSHLAALHRFGQQVEYVAVGSISAVFEEVLRGHAQFGIVPLENSTDGRIADTLDMFIRTPARICGQVELEIHHTLLAKCPRSEIREVYSRPQALSQCRNWLAKHLPGARLIEVTSTSTAAQLASEKPGAAAIASLQAGVFYGLTPLAENIEDNPGNTTRFAIIGNQICARTGNDKTALMFQVEHRPGALADAMNVFKRNRLNLTWIESFPAPGCRGAYYFFVELEGHESEQRVRRALNALKSKTQRLEILGSYPVTAPVST
ncbi:MAG: prephenate dehydratase [Thermogutta sp.]|jgi:chorismate mutase/prephenate dehydratase